jgi:hypothetical protein
MNEIIQVGQKSSPSIIPTPHELLVYQTMAKQAIESKLYRSPGDEAGVLMIMLSARELNLPAMQALNGGINIIQGKVELSARLMNALMRRAGISITIKESTEDRCVLIGRRGDTQDTAVVSYTILEAQKAGLVKPGGGWVKNPKDMLFARAISRLARQIAPDVIGGCYIEGEIKATDAEVVIPNDIQMETKEDPQEDERNIQRLVEIFDINDFPLVMEYVEVVMNHFGWTKAQTIKEFLKDEKNLVEKFNSWKNRKK